MELLLPNSNNIRRYHGPGGYQVQTATFAIRKYVNDLGIYHVAVPPHHTSKEHYHGTLTEIFYTLTPMHLKLNGIMHYVPIGAIVVLQPGDQHEVYAQETEIRYLAVKIPDSVSDKILVNK